MSACFNRKWPEIFGYLGVFFGWMEETWGVYVRKSQRGGESEQSGLQGRRLRLKLRNFGEVEVSHLHCRRYDVERFFTRGANGDAHGLDIREDVNQALVETEISDPAANPSIFDQKSTVAGHPGQHFFKRLNFADVPEPGD